MIRKTEKWAWLKKNGDLQDDLFETADGAIEEMRNRVGRDEPIFDIMRKVGSKLVRVRVTVETIAILEDIDWGSQ